MKFERTSLEGAYVLIPERNEDSRGFFARTFCRDEFERMGLDAGVVQCSISYNRVRGTLRGLHYQIEPYEEVKLVRCTRGSIYDVIVDLRESSSTRGKWFAVELSQENRKALYVPKGFAHGFQTLEDGSEVFYQMTEFYQATHSRAIRWNDPSIGVEWPVAAPILHDRDANAPAQG